MRKKKKNAIWGRPVGSGKENKLKHLAVYVSDKTLEKLIELATENNSTKSTEANKILSDFLN